MSHHNAHWQKVKSGEKSIKAACKMSPLTLFLVFLVSKPVHTDAHPDNNISLILLTLFENVSIFIKSANTGNMLYTVYFFITLLKFAKCCLQCRSRLRYPIHYVRSINSNYFFILFIFLEIFQFVLDFWKSLSALFKQVLNSSQTTDYRATVLSVQNIALALNF